MANAFARLPPELLVMILRDLPDLPSVYRFICASSKVNAAFAIDAANILNGIIERSIPRFKPLARVISVIGSLDIHTRSKTQDSKIFDSLVAKHKSLPEGRLTNDTLGARYLLLTAYRIEHLQYICFTTLLQNIHEHIFISHVDKNTTPDKLSELMSFRSGAFFKPAAWWSPSWVERFRIERALWKLFIYWNIRAIHYDNSLGQDPDFSQYNEKIMDINPDIGVKNGHRQRDLWEMDEINCVSDAVREFLNLDPMRYFTELPIQTRQQFIERTWSKFSLSHKENGSWRFEEPKPAKTSYPYYDWGQSVHWIDQPNSKTRNLHSLYWHFVSKDLHLQRYELYFPEPRPLSLGLQAAAVSWVKRLSRLFMGFFFGAAKAA